MAFEFDTDTPAVSPLIGATYGGYNYNLDSVYTLPGTAPASGTVRVNNANAQLVTTVWMSINTADATPLNLTSFINNIVPGDSIVLQNKTDPTAWQQYLVSANTAFFTPNRALTVSWVTGGKPLTAGPVVFGVIPGLRTALGPPVFTSAPVPPSAPGQAYPIYTSGSATVPATPLSITGSPIIPTSAFPPGGGVGSIGDPVGYPTFPPPTPPPIGTVPAGPLVGPAVAASAVPPSIAGDVQPKYKTGSATSPTAASWFPQFTTTGAYTGFPNQPPAGVPIVFANISTKPSLSGGVWTVVTPPSTATTGQIILNGWGLPGPSGLGPGPPTYPNPPGAGLPHLAGASSNIGVPTPQFPTADTLYLYAGASRKKRKINPQPSATMR